MSYSHSIRVEQLAIASLIWNTRAKCSSTIKAQPCSGLRLPLTWSGPSQRPAAFALALFSSVYTTHLEISHIHIHTADDTDLHTPHLNYSSHHLPNYDNCRKTVMSISYLSRPKNWVTTYHRGNMLYINFFIQVFMSLVNRCQDVTDFSMSCHVIT